MKSKPEDNNNSQYNIENNRKQQSETGYERIQIANSPFWIIGEPDGGYAAVMAEYQITNKFKTAKEVTDSIETNHWEIIMRMTAIIVEKMLKEKEEEAQLIKEKTLHKYDFADGAHIK